MTSRDLMIAGLVARRAFEHDMEKAAAPTTAGGVLAQGAGQVAQGVLGTLRGAGSTISAGTRAMGAEASKNMGGGLAGRAVDLGIRAAPWVAGAGVANQALGNPVGQVGRQALDNYKARMLQQSAAWDPNAGVMY